MMHETETGFRKSSRTWADNTARGLGYFSIALGVAELAFPGLLARTLGLKQQDGLVRSYGLREIVAGVGALQPNPVPAVWSRVAGDVLDLATLSPGLREDNEKRRAATAAIATVAAVTVLDILVAATLSKQMARKEEPRDFSERSGYPGGYAASHGAAAGYRGPDFMRAPRDGGGKPVESQSANPL